MATVVIFRKFRDQGDIIALFPEHPGTNDPSTCSSYQRLGQHGAATLPHIIQATVLAAPKEYAALKRELKAVGYTRLTLAKKVLYSHWVKRLAAIRRSTTCVGELASTGSSPAPCG